MTNNTENMTPVLRGDQTERWLRGNQEILAPVETSGPISQNPNSFTAQEYITRHDNMQKAVDQSGGMTSGLEAMARRDQCGRE